MITEAFFSAIKECVEIIPFLLLIFYIIEFVEHFYSDKLLALNFKKGTGFAPLIGALLASIPQCGLSVIASTLYVKRFITKGTLIAVYLATSDEAVPVLLANPGSTGILFPLILIKIFTGVTAGYLIDKFLPSKVFAKSACVKEVDFEKGCHSHSVAKKRDKGIRACKFEEMRELFLHPLVHTAGVIFFVFLVTFTINIVFSNNFMINGFLTNPLFVSFKPVIEPVVVALFGIIPNCAVSVGIAIMYLKGVISFASCVSGLCAGAGLGILVLIRKNEDKKDTIQIMVLLLLISIFAGLLTEIICSH